MRPLALLIALCLPLAATAAEHLAVLELQNASPLPAPEVRYLTERVRGVAQAHPVPGLALMTRANLAALLPPGVDLADCEGECAVETGRIVGADYVVAGEVVSLGGSLRAILTLHATADGKQLAAVHAGGADAVALERDLARAADRLFESLPGASPPPPPPALLPAGTLRVTSEPAGAEVWQGHALIGLTPLARPIEGDWRGNLELRLADHVSGYHYVMLRPGRDEAVHVRLLPRKSRATIQARDPEGLPCQGDVRINQERVGSAPWVGDLTQGSWRVDVGCGHRTASRTVYWPSAQTVVELEAHDRSIQLGAELIGAGGWELNYTGWFADRARGTLRAGLELHGGRFPLGEVDPGYEEAAWHVGMQLRVGFAVTQRVDWTFDFTVDIAWASCEDDADPTSDCALKDRVDAFDLFPLIGGATGLRYDLGAVAFDTGLWLLKPFMYREPGASVSPYMGAAVLF
ncbi:MAG: hypothetical protein H6706_03460 [Myxococcales bacterium]|nr:hypothetical protein [Myxococcales bacterium]